MASEKGRQGLFRGEGEENTGETNQGQRDAGENHTQSQKNMSVTAAFLKLCFFFLKGKKGILKYIYF